MKPEERTGVQNPEVLDFKSIDPKNTSYLENAKCKGGNLCIDLCVSEHCESTAALCHDLKCECRLNHNNGKVCSMGLLKIIVEMTENKKHSFPQVLNWINKKYDELIDWISDEREKLEQQMKSLGLNEDQKSFLKTVYGGEFSKLTGKQMHKIVNDANLESKQLLQQMTSQIQQQLSLQWEICIEQIQKEVISINQLITRTCLQGTEAKEEIVGLDNSNVLETETEIATVTEMLEEGRNNNRKLSKIKLLYRASDNNFDIKKFWEKCNHKADTVTLARTEFDKVIGGYTPLSWKREKHGHWEQDPSLQSFLFSVTEKTKFTLKQSKKQSAIGHNTTVGPFFGSGADFSIKNRTNSLADIGRSYENSKVQYNTKEAWQFFQGSTDTYIFEIEEWEVWQVTFE